MRVLVWGINYAPECTGIAPFNVALCEFLHAAGDDVEMVTTFPYYPAWRKEPHDQGRLYRTDLLNGIRVHRCWHYVPGRVRSWKRILHEASFVFTSFLRLLSLKRAEVLVVVSPPLLLGAAAWLLGLLKRAPFVFHVQDLQPDAALGLGMLPSGPLTRALYGLEAFSYAKASRVSGISPGMLEAFQRKGVPAAKCVYFPNGIDFSQSPQLGDRGGFRRRLGFGEDQFLAVYSGNLGFKQGLGVLIDAARKLTDSRIRIVICGEGPQREGLAEASRDLPNVHLVPLQDARGYRELLADTDLYLIPQQAGSGQSFLPSKLLNALAASKPVLAVADADSALTRTVEEAGLGRAVRPGDASAVAAAIESMSKQSLEPLGRAGRAFAGRFEIGKVMAEFREVLATVAGRGC